MDNCSHQTLVPGCAACDWARDMEAYLDAHAHLTNRELSELEAKRRREEWDSYDPYNEEGAAENPLAGKLKTLDDLRRMPPPRPLNGYLFWDSLAWLAGPPGCYKSFLAVQWAAELVACGNTVLYVAAEGVAGMTRRFDSWQEANRVRLGNGLVFLPEAVNVSTDWGHLVGIVEELKPALIVIDTQARMTPGLEEISGKDMGVYIDGADRLRKATGGCVLTLHHTPKGGETLRGHTSLPGAADTIVSIFRASDQEPFIRVRNAKAKDSEPVPECFLRAVRYGESVVLQECEKPADWDAWVRQKVG